MYIQYLVYYVKLTEYFPFPFPQPPVLHIPKKGMKGNLKTVKP